GIIALMIAAGEAVALAMALASGASFVHVLAIHAVATVALAIWCTFTWRGGGDVAIPVMAFLISLVAGPLGALGAGALAWIGRPTGADQPRLLAGWYARIANSITTDPVSQLCEHVAVGRAVDLSEEPPTSFLHTMSSGPLVERQTVLGIVARKFHFDYLPVLRAALDNPEPVIRVQAAAVAARVRGDLKSEMDRLIAAAASPPIDIGGRLALAAKLDLGIEARLVDQITAQAAGAARDTLLDGCDEREVANWCQRARRHRQLPPFDLAAIRAGGQHAELPSPQWIDAPRLVDSFERRLIRAGRYAALRRVRALLRAGAAHPGARLRSIELRDASPSAAGT
ncbi:MAG TPA: hypothetical protein PK264_18055, partial [Hyphomicrobiaceae bacterium]|nr:hypothetical protein [Hyphomicrobiaceae bacterium]